MPRICPRCGAIAGDNERFCHMDGTPLAEHPVTPHQAAAAARSQAPAPTEVEKESYLGRTLLNQFHLLEIAGSGSMGTVYKARQAEIDRIVAVKILHPELANQPEAVLRFHREAKVISTLSHPNIVHIYLFGHLPDGNLFIVQEFVNGRSLAVDMEAGPLGLRRSLHIADQILSAIAEAHGHGVIHRDLKPENIMLSTVSQDGDFVKILDFGVAKRITTQTFATREGLIFGSPRYISPEAAAGDKVDQRSDLYSFGVILYQMLCGEPPFSGRKPVQLLMDHLNAPPPALRNRPGAVDVPEVVERIVMKLLAKRPEHRYPTATAVREALIDATHGAGAASPVLGGQYPREPAQSARDAPPPEQFSPYFDAQRRAEQQRPVPAHAAAAPQAGARSPQQGPVRVPTAQASVVFGGGDGSAPTSSASGSAPLHSSGEWDEHSEGDVTSTQAMFVREHRQRLLVRALVAVSVIVLLPLVVVGAWFGYRMLSKHLFPYDRVASIGSPDAASSDGAAGTTDPASAADAPLLTLVQSLDEALPSAGKQVSLLASVEGLPGAEPRAWFLVVASDGTSTSVPALQVQVQGDGTVGRLFGATHEFPSEGDYTVRFMIEGVEVEPPLKVKVSAPDGSSPDGKDRPKGNKKKGGKSSGQGASPDSVDPATPPVKAPPPPGPEEKTPGGIKIIKIGSDPDPPVKKSSWY